MYTLSSESQTVDYQATVCQSLGKIRKDIEAPVLCLLQPSGTSLWNRSSQCFVFPPADNVICESLGWGGKWEWIISYPRSYTSADRAPNHEGYQVFPQTGWCYVLPPVRYWPLGVVSQSERRRRYPQGCCHWDNWCAKCGSSRPCDSVSVQIIALHELPTHSS